MRKLKFSLVLTVGQLVVAIFLLNLAHSDRSGVGFDTPYASTAAMVCYGINAPALLFKAFAILFLNYSFGRIKFLNGYGIDEALFLSGVICLWMVVGQLIERRPRLTGASLEPQTGKRKWVRLALYLLLAACGLFLGDQAVSSIVHFGRWNNPTGNVIEGVLFATWAVVLLFFCVSRIMRIYQSTTQSREP